MRWGVEATTKTQVGKRGWRAAQATERFAYFFSGFHWSVNWIFFSVIRTLHPSSFPAFDGENLTITYFIVLNHPPSPFPPSVQSCSYPALNGKHQVIICFFFLSAPCSFVLQCNLHGAIPKAWPPAALAAVKRCVHEVLQLSYAMITYVHAQRQAYCSCANRPW